MKADEQAISAAQEEPTSHASVSNEQAPKIQNHSSSNMTKQSLSISHEDQMRAEVYGFIARLLLSVPDQARLDQLAKLQGDDTPLGEAFGLLAKLAGNVTQSEVNDEYNALFIGMGRGELLPYASYYLTGFLNEKPLAKLRANMKELGIERRDEVKEPEDHMGSLMEMMAGLIVGELGAEENQEGQSVPVSLEIQQAFFNAHIAPWAAYFFQDIERAKGAKFYQPLGTIGRLFVEIESNAFEML